MRPWALAAPVLVLLIAAPLLRPLLNPGITSGRERATLLSVRSVLRTQTLAFAAPIDLDPTDFYRDANGRAFSAEPPAFVVYLAGVAWGVEQTGLNFDRNRLLLEYLLILFAITLPTALASGLLYRCGRVFELHRPWRAALALGCVLTTGWLSYSVALLPHAVAASLVIAAVASVLHVLISKRANLAAGWLAAGGFTAGAATVIEPSAVWILGVLPAAILALPHTRRVRMTGLLLAGLGAASPMVLHMTLNQAVTGSLLPPRWHMRETTEAIPALPVSATADESDPIDASLWAATGSALNRVLVFTVGAHGIFSHFPMLVIAFAGTITVLHRHWPKALKWIAGGAVCGLILLIGLRMIGRVDASDNDFAAPKLLTPLPVLMLCVGAWLRRDHPPITRIAAMIAAALSSVITLIGATAPAPALGYTGYTAAQAVEQWLLPAKTKPTGMRMSDPTTTSTTRDRR